MAKRYRHLAKVRHRGAFPIDMLRYDGAYPRHEVDSHKIERVNAYQHGQVGVPQPQPEDQTIEVERVDDNRDFRWTVDRWRSFGTEILETSTEKLP